MLRLRYFIKVYARIKRKLQIRITTCFYVSIVFKKKVLILGKRFYFLIKDKIIINFENLHKLDISKKLERLCLNLKIKGLMTI